MPPSRHETVRVSLRKDQLIRLNLLRTALAEKMKKDMSLSEIIEKIVDEFLESK